MMWGKHKENGVWLGGRSRRRLIVKRHSLYLAFGRVRVRLIWPV